MDAYELPRLPAAPWRNPTEYRLNQLRDCASIFEIMPNPINVDMNLIPTARKCKWYKNCGGNAEKIVEMMTKYRDRVKQFGRHTKNEEYKQDFKDMVYHIDSLFDHLRTTGAFDDFAWLCMNTITETFNDWPN